jgi:hypothetical protein
MSQKVLRVKSIKGKPTEKHISSSKETMLVLTNGDSR